MNKIVKNEKGFTAVEGLLIVLILVVITAVGYMVYHYNHDTKTAAVSTTAAKTSKSSSTKLTANPYAGWKTYELKYEKISFEYPSNWTPTDTSSSGIDKVSFQSNDNFTFNIEDGASSGGDSIILDSNNPLKVKFDGSNDYVVFSNGIAGNPDNSATSPITGASLLTDPTNYISYPTDKNVTNVYNSDYDANGSLLTVFMSYSNAQSKQETIQQAIADKEFVNSQLVIDSMHY
jgi:Tfp pilus assembly protein PilE